MIGQIFNTIFLYPIHNILVAFIKLFQSIHLPGAFGLAIVCLVVLVRFILHPFFKQQLETSKKMQELKPQLDRLTEKYKKDPKQLQAEQMKLYQQAGINPAAGCVFMVIQIPVFIGLYNTLTQFLKGSGPKALDEINKSLYFPGMKLQNIDPHFLGFNLAMSPQHAGLWYYYAVPVVTGILQFFQARASMPQTSHTPDIKKDDKDSEKKLDTGGDFQKAMSTQMQYILPVMIGYFSFTLPVGLSLYWNIFSIFSIIQYKMVHKKVGDEKLSVIEEKKLEQLTSKSSKKKK
ncbi:MAG: YidC/Oxa1 family membrane protein insertase [Patescibacteria group bacterium]